MTLDDRVSWGFALALAVLGLAVTYWFSLVVGLAFLVLGCAGMQRVRLRFRRRAAEARVDHPGR